jgi:hypothetical protein
LDLPGEARWTREDGFLHDTAVTPPQLAVRSGCVEVQQFCVGLSLLLYARHLSPDKNTSECALPASARAPVRAQHGCCARSLHRPSNLSNVTKDTSFRRGVRWTTNIPRALFECTHFVVAEQTTCDLRYLPFRRSHVTWMALSGCECLSPDCGGAQRGKAGRKGTRSFPSASRVVHHVLAP